MEDFITKPEVFYTKDNITVMGSEPMPDLPAEEFRSKVGTITSIQQLADAYAIASNEFWWVEDNVYDYKEGTDEYRNAVAVADSWEKVMYEYENMVFDILRSEGVIIPERGTIYVLKPFMSRYGYIDGSGWWIKSSNL